MNTISPSPPNNYQLRPAICSALIFLAVVFGGVVCMVVNSTNTKPRLEYLLLGVTCLGIGTIATSVSIICFVLKQSRVIEKIPPNKAPPPKSVPFVVDRLMARAATNLEYRACEDLLSSNTVRPSTTMHCAYKSNYHVV
uniref:Uncharacterized LOC100178897 n=1 Tax=Ciona intestinalis TaxID=7719 RepID=F6PWT9_CIOIN|nr:uncharacterized protein LOC100178897 [Ciona intestinalis]|eukprot:XP_002126012.2 uncharacterized protein LOC100178897 [Ciona intestinalis]